MQWSLRLIAVAVLVGITFLYPLTAPPAHRIDQQHFNLIRPGMTQADVEAIFGVPAGVYDWVMIANDNPKWPTVWLKQNASNAIIPVQWPRANNAQVWLSRHGVFVISVEEHNLVRTFQLPGTPMTEPPWKKWWYKLRSL